MISLPDRRRQRAMGLAREVFHRIERFLTPGDERFAMDAIMDAFTDAGVEVLTDHVREDIGLEPRGPDGWTLQEIIALERVYLERLTSPPPPPRIWITQGEPIRVGGSGPEAI